MNTGILNNDGQDLQTDLLSIAKENLSDKDFTDFSNFLSECESSVFTDLTNLSNSNKRQLEFKIDFVNERFYLDRVVTYSRIHLKCNDYFKLMIKLSEVCIGHGMYNYAQELLRSVKKENMSRAVQVDSLFIQADIYARKGKWQQSLASLKKAKKIFISLEDQTGLAKCENLIGSIYGEVGKLEKADEHFKKSHELAKSIKDLKLQAMLEINLGIINSIRTDYEVASIYYSDALTKLGMLADYRRMSEVEHNIGMMYREKNEFDAAMSHFDNAINISIMNECHSILAIAYTGKAELLAEHGELVYASAVLQKAFETAHELNDKLTIAEVYRIRGIIARKNKKYQQAENCYKSALVINNKLDARLNTAECNYELALLYREVNDDKTELRYLNNSLTYYNQLNHEPQIAEIRKRLEEIGCTNFGTMT